MTARLLYDVNEAAQQLSLSPKSVERLMADGQIRTVKIGRRRLYPHDELVAYVERVKKAS